MDRVPDQSRVHGFAHGGAAEQDDLAGEQHRVRRQGIARGALDPGSIEDDGSERQHFQPGFRTNGVAGAENDGGASAAVDLFGGLRQDQDIRVRFQRYVDAKPVATDQPAGGIDQHGGFRFPGLGIGSEHA